MEGEYSGRFCKGRLEEMTLEDIARELGVSKSTVSRALSGKGRIGEQTRQRIREYAQGYGDGRQQEREKDKRTGNIGVSFPDDILMSGSQFF